MDDELWISVPMTASWSARVRGPEKVRVSMLPGDEFAFGLEVVLDGLARAA